MPTPAEIKKSFSAARILGNGDDRVTLSENELLCLLTQCCDDLAIPNSISKLPLLSLPAPNKDYYRLPLAWFQSAQANCLSAPALVEAYAACVAHEADFRLYFENLAGRARHACDWVFQFRGIHVETTWNAFARPVFAQGIIDAVGVLPVRVPHFLRGV